MDCRTGLTHGSPFACLRKRERGVYWFNGFYRFNEGCGA